MSNVAMLAEAAIHRAPSGEQAAEPGDVSKAVRWLFVLLQGYYGSLFLAKWSTGVKDGGGRDLGIRAAMRVWDEQLARFQADVVTAATGRLLETNPEFPPTLPQFVQLCQAAAPRKSFAEEQGWPLLAPPEPAKPVAVSVKPKNDGKDWARRLVARHEAGDKLRPMQLRFAREALGMEGKQAWQ